MNAPDSGIKINKEGKGGDINQIQSNQIKYKNEVNRHRQGEASRGVSCPKIKIKHIKTGAGPIPDSPTVYCRKKTLVCGKERRILIRLW